MKPLIVTSGDPAGIGPEITLKAARYWIDQQPNSWSKSRPLLLAGDQALLKQLASDLSIPTTEMIFLDVPAEKNLIKTGQVGKAAGQAAFDAIRASVAQCVRGEAAGIVTAPINKESLAAAGHPWPGHTEMLADLASPSAPPAVRMMLVNPDLRVVLNSVHESLRDMLDGLDTAGLLKTILLTQSACQQLGVKSPRIAVAGLNPHASENGLFGREDRDIVAPAINQARSLGLDVSGPWPPDTVFMRARCHKDFDVVVALYHDQGLIPIKYLGLDQGVNLTLGLPFIRTSVDHGTAFDIAGKGIADPSSLVAALSLADRLALQAEHPASCTTQ